MATTTNTTRERANKPINPEHAAAWAAGFKVVKRTSHDCAYYYMVDADGFDLHNAKGEKICVEVSASYNPGGRNSIPRHWHKLGYTPTELQTWWSVNTYVTTADGVCSGKYNPTHILGKCQLNFAWVKEATPSNLRRILEEVARQFFNA